jgi:hypothetical protein
MLYERDVKGSAEKWVTAQQLPANLKVDESVHPQTYSAPKNCLSIGCISIACSF